MEERMDTFQTPRITVIEHRPGHYKPDTVADGTMLRSITGRGYFPEEEYDYVLAAVSLAGYCLETIRYK